MASFTGVDSEASAEAWECPAGRVRAALDNPICADALALCIDDAMLSRAYLITANKIALAVRAGRAAYRERRAEEIAVGGIDRTPSAFWRNHVGE